MVADQSAEHTDRTKWRVAVIGGRGFLGRRTVAALAAIPEVEVRSASRRPVEDDVAVDLTRPETFDTVVPFDAVVNCADALVAAPQALCSFCRERGILFIESTADAGTIERLLRDREPTGPGAAVVGVGLFPGISNLLGAHVARAADSRAGGEPDGAGPAGIAIEIAIDPFSGAGPGTIGVMAKVARTPGLAMPEQITLQAALGAREIQVRFVPGMRWARPLARWGGRLLPKNRWFRRLLGGATRLFMTPLRRLLFRRRSGRITIVARCGDAVVEARTRRGFDATARAIAATAALALRSQIPAGCHALEVVASAAELMREMDRYPGGDLTLAPTLPKK